MTPPSHHELDAVTKRLWLCFLAGEALDADEKGQLAATVRAGGPSGRALVADETLHRTLLALGRSAADEATFVKWVEARTPPDLSTERFVAAVDRRIMGRLRRHRSWPIVASVAGLLAAAGVLLFVGRPPMPHAPLSESADVGGPVTVLSGAFTTGDRRIASGQTVPQAAELLAAEEAACLRLGSSGHICLARDARASLVAAGKAGWRMTLLDGKAAAAVIGGVLTAALPGIEVVARSATFSVDAGSQRDPIVRVLLGAVRVSGARPVVVDAHHAYTVATGVRSMDAQDEGPAWALVNGREPGGGVQPPTPGATEIDRLIELAQVLHAHGRHSEANGIQSRLSRQHPIGWDPPLPALHRIRAGGPEYVDPRGNVWAADEFFTGGQTFRASKPIGGTVMDPLYQTERNGFRTAGFSYDLPVPAGRYVVYLHFAEIYWSMDRPDARRFDVLIEGQKVLAGYNIAADVGSDAAVAKPFVVQVADAGVTIEFRNVVENAKISAIEVYPLPPGALPPPGAIRGEPGARERPLDRNAQL